MKLKVNPNRMEVLRLTKRLALAERGYNLLKDKQEELVRQFIELVRKIRKLRTEVEKKLLKGYEAFLSARLDMQPEAVEDALSFSNEQIELDITLTPLMNLRVPKLQIKESAGEGGFSYGYVNTSGDLDISLRIFSELIPGLIEIAETEKSLQLLSDELERTRRRVNALEHILIPSLEETIKFIRDRLSELERSNLTRLMKVKDMVLERKK